MVLYTEDLYDWTQPELMEFNIYNFAIIIAGRRVNRPSSSGSSSPICSVLRSAYLEVLVSLVPFTVAPASTSLYNYTIDFLPGHYSN